MSNEPQCRSLRDNLRLTLCLPELQKPSSTIGFHQLSSPDACAICRLHLSNRRASDSVNVLEKNSAQVLAKQPPYPPSPRCVPPPGNLIIVQPLNRTSSTRAQQACCTKPARYGPSGPARIVLPGARPSPSPQPRPEASSTLWSAKYKPPSATHSSDEAAGTM